MIEIGAANLKFLFRHTILQKPALLVFQQLKSTSTISKKKKKKREHIHKAPTAMQAATSSRFLAIRRCLSN
jgi:hypothetical protein